MEQVLPVGNGSGAERKWLATVEEVKVNLNTELLLTIVKKLDKISTANLEEKEEMFKYLILLPPPHIKRWAYASWWICMYITNISEIVKLITYLKKNTAFDINNGDWIKQFFKN